MHDYDMEFQFLREMIAEKLENGELTSEGYIALDRKLERIYAIGYYMGRLHGERYRKGVKQ